MGITRLNRALCGVYQGLTGADSAQTAESTGYDGCTELSKHTLFKRHRPLLLIISVLLLLGSTEAFGIVLHPDGEPNLTTWLDRPDCNVVGRWGENSSCVAIAPNHILACKHQGGDVNTPVVIGGVTYSVDQILNHPTADLRVVKLHSANLGNYVQLYTEPNEISREIIIAGFGRGRGTTVYKSFPKVAKGYTWSTEAEYNNHTQRWGTNRVEANDIGTSGSGYISHVLIADFDAPDANSSTVYEGTIAQYDSGGGWFIKSGGIWKVAGLNRAVYDLHAENYADAQSWFLPPDYIDAVRVSYYTVWIADRTTPLCSGPMAGDFNGDCIIDIEDLGEFSMWYLWDNCDKDNNFCQGSDLDGSGYVDLKDFANLACVWLQDHQIQ